MRGWGGAPCGDRENAREGLPVEPKDFGEDENEDHGDENSRFIHVCAYGLCTIALRESEIRPEVGFEVEWFEVDSGGGVQCQVVRRVEMRARGRAYSAI
jgi:hypothetical protein